jgi:hypothetical protein
MRTNPAYEGLARPYNIVLLAFESLVRVSTQVEFYRMRQVGIIVEVNRKSQNSGDLMVFGWWKCTPVSERNLTLAVNKRGDCASQDCGWSATENSNQTCQKQQPVSA